MTTITTTVTEPKSFQQIQDQQKNLEKEKVLESLNKNIIKLIQTINDKDQITKNDQDRQLKINQLELSKLQLKRARLGLARDERYYDTHSYEGSKRSASYFSGTNRESYSKGGAIALSLATGGLINPVVAKSILFPMLAPPLKLLSKTASGLLGSLSSIFPMLNRNISGKTSSAITSTKNDKLYSKLDEILNAVKQNSKRSSKQKEKKQSGFLGSLLGLAGLAGLIGLPFFPNGEGFRKFVENIAIGVVGAIVAKYGFDKILKEFSKSKRVTEKAEAEKARKEADKTRKEADKKLKEAEEKLKKAEEKLRETENKLKKAEEEIKKAKSENEKIKKEYEKAKSENEKAKEELKKAKEELKSEKEKYKEELKNVKKENAKNAEKSKSTADPKKTRKAVVSHDSSNEKVKKVQNDSNVNKASDKRRVYRDPDTGKIKTKKAPSNGGKNETVQTSTKKAEPVGSNKNSTTKGTSSRKGNPKGKSPGIGGLLGKFISALFLADMVEGVEEIVIDAAINGAEPVSEELKQNSQENFIKLYTGTGDNVTLREAFHELKTSGSHLVHGRFKQAYKAIEGIRSDTRWELLNIFGHAATVYGDDDVWSEIMGSEKKKQEITKIIDRKAREVAYKKEHPLETNLQVPIIDSGNAQSKDGKIILPSNEVKEGEYIIFDPETKTYKRTRVKKDLNTNSLFIGGKGRFVTSTLRSNTLNDFSEQGPLMPDEAIAVVEDIHLVSPESQINTSHDPTLSLNLNLLTNALNNNSEVIKNNNDLLSVIPNDTEPSPMFQSPGIQPTINGINPYNNF